MYARVTMFPGLAPERIKATLDEFQSEMLPQLEKCAGYQGVWCGVDFTGGRAIAVTYWDTLDSLHGSDEIASHARAAAVTRAGVDRNRPPLIDQYEVVIQQTPAHA